MADCPDIRDKMLELLYDELPDEEQSVLSQHVAGCNSCEKELSELRGVRQAFSSLPDAAPPPGVSAYVLAEAAKAAERAQSGGLFGRLAAAIQSIGAYPGLAAAASLVLVVTVAGTMYWKNGRDMVAQPGAAQTDATRLSETQEEAALGKDEPFAPAVVADAAPAGAGDGNWGRYGLDKAAPPTKEPAAKKALGVGNDLRKEKGRPVDLASKEQDAKALERVKASMDSRVRSARKKMERSKLSSAPDSQPAEARRAASKDSFRDQLRQDGVMGASAGSADEDVAKRNYVSKQGESAPKPAASPKQDEAKPVATKSKFAAPPPNSAQVMEEADAADDEVEGEAAPEPEVSPAARKLHNQLKSALARKDCNKALTLGSRIRSEDSNFFGRTVETNKSYSRCRRVQRQRAAEKQRKSKSVKPATKSKTK